jgi:exonuclease SbcD
MSFRFLHIADLHLDAPFSGQEALKPRLVQAQRDSLAAAVDACLEHRVHALFIAGDLVDQGQASGETASFIRRQLERLHQQGIGVFYAYGNHDPASSALVLPGWVEVFDSRYARMVEVRSASGEVVGAVVGAGFVRAQEYDSPMDFFPRRHGKIPTVGILHTQLIEEAGKGTPYSPVSLSRLESLEYDYWALGHIHRRQSYGPHVHYSGCLCATGFQDPGPQGGLLVEVEGRGTPRVRVLPLARVIWRQQQVNGLARAVDEESLFHQALAVLQEEDTQVPAMIRLTLQGQVGCWAQLTSARGPAMLEALGRRLTQALGAIDVAVEARELTAPEQIGEYRGQVSLLGEMLDTLSLAMTDDALLDALLEQAAPLGLAGCQHAGREQTRQYARQILKDMAPAAMELMKKEERP